MFSDPSVESLRRMQKLGMTALIAAALFYAVVCSPVSILINSNVRFRGTVLPVLWDFVSILAQYFYYWIFFSFLIHGTAENGLSSAKPLCITFGIASISRYFVSLMIGTIIMSDWGGFGYECKLMIPAILGDFLIAGLAVLFTWLFFRNHNQKACACAAERVFDLSSPSLRAAMTSVAIPSVLSLLSRLRFDLFFGDPQSRYDLLTMIISYAGDIFSILIGYLVVFLVLEKLKKYAAEID